MKLISVSKQFGKHIIFSNLTLEFQFGKTYCIRGKSGCGKTTLLNLLAKLEEPDEGCILYRSQNLKDIKSVDFFRNELGYLFQNFGLMEDKSVRENLDLGFVGRKMRKKDKEAMEIDVIRHVGLKVVSLDQNIYQLSGGEAQRVALAKMLLKKPSLLLADEPTASLDPQTGQEIMRLLLTMRSPERLIIIASHNPTIWALVDECITLG